MKKTLLFSLMLVFLQVLTNAQTGTITPAGAGQPQPKTNNAGSPYFQNPYNTNGFEINKSTSDNLDNKNGKTLSTGENNKEGNKTNNPLQDMNKNGTPKDIDKLKEKYKDDPDYIRYLNSLEDGNTEKGNDDQLEPGKDVRIVKDTLDKDKKKKLKKVYGDGFFSANSSDFSDRTPTSAPSSYRVGPGDELVVAAWGDAELQQTYLIGKDGSIFPRFVGKIYVQGQTLDEVQRNVSMRMKKVMPNNTRVDVQLGKARTIRVTILGEVNRQGTYTVSGFTTALNALFKAGGLTDIGNMRRIEIKRSGKTVDVIDLYKYLQSSKRNDEIYLEDNDYIYVGVYDKLVFAEGMFKRPMYYQLVGDEGLRDLVDFTGGPASSARNSLIHIKTISNEEEKYIDIPGNDYFNTYKNKEYMEIVLKDGDVVNLKGINTGLRNVVKVKGAVAYPDDYEVRENERLSDILRKAGGILSETYLPRAYIMRGTNPIESEALKVNLTKLEESNNINNVFIEPGDEITVLSYRDFEDNYFIDVFGSVRKPVKLKYNKNITLKDALLLAGGLTLDAENGRIEISNVVDSVDKYNLIGNNPSVKTVSINSNLELDEVSEMIVLKPSDRIYVRKKIEFVALENIRIMGEINFPGEYSLNTKTERISSLIKRAGGIKKSAYIEGAKLYRAGIGQVVIDLESILKYKGKNNKDDLILRDKDLLMIPIMNDIVAIKGEVQSEVNIKFDANSSRVDYYIQAAGGFKENPWRRRIYVKYQNGQIKSTKQFMFVRNYPKVKEGATIFVPTKPFKEKKTSFGEVLGYTLSTISTLATVVVLAVKL
jgi:protein involved in polysaccharide export with SLBB domain